ncbi:hypothetical protein IWW39_004534 [Coemansia spiralis]|uniref:LITAF domain-containing protein n=1 Tax=Coemansia spiralis TaxID=417178 RepID=A0A9W8GH46_9FUNG|nr:hypothetical protein IWW39_004534 [Coemansia spiralis]
MDEKQRLAEADRAGNVEAAQTNSQSTPLYDDPPLYNSRAAPAAPAPPPAAAQPPYGPYGDSGATQSPYGPYNNSGASAPGLGPSPGQQQQEAVVGQKVVVDGVEGVRLPPGSYIEVKDIPANITCPKCLQPIVTQIKTKTGTKTVVAAVAIALVFWPLAFIPFMSRRLKKKIHVCPHCKHNLGDIVTVTAVKPYVPEQQQQQQQPQHPPQPQQQR